MRWLTLFLLAFRAYATDLSGEWKFDIMLDGRNLTPEASFRQTGELLAGTFGSAGPIAGTVRGSKLTFRAGKVALVYAGDIETAITLKGRILLGGKRVGTWTAEKK
jgi:hypothetical protein